MPARYAAALAVLPAGAALSAPSLTELRATTLTMSHFPRIGHPDADEWAAECETAYEAEWGGRDGEILVISGSRRHPNLRMVERYLRWYFSQLPKNTVIRTGGAEGVDQLAERIAGEIGLPTETLRPFYPAYPREPKRAPLERNTVLVNGGVHRDKLWASCSKMLAFPDNLDRKGGTWDTIRKGRAAGKATGVIRPDGTKVKQAG